MPYDKKEANGIQSSKLEGKVLHLKTDRGSFNVDIGSNDPDKVKIEKNPNGMGYVVKVETGENTWNEYSLAQAHETTTKKEGGLFGIGQTDVKQDHVSNIVNFKAKTLDENGEEKTITSSRAMFDDKGKSFGTLSNANAIKSPNEGTTISYNRDDNQRTFLDRAGQFGTGLAETGIGAYTTAMGGLTALAGATITATGAGALPGIPLAAGGVGLTAIGATATVDGVGKIFNAFSDDGGKHNVAVSTGGKTTQYSDDKMENIQNNINKDLGIKPIDLSSPLSLLSGDTYNAFTQDFTRGIDEKNYDTSKLKYNEPAKNIFES